MLAYVAIVMDQRRYNQCRYLLRLARKLRTIVKCSSNLRATRPTGSGAVISGRLEWPFSGDYHRINPCRAPSADRPTLIARFGRSACNRNAVLAYAALAPTSTGVAASNRPAAAILLVATRIGEVSKGLPRLLTTGCQDATCLY